MFIGAGVGVTPLRALFESTVAGPGGSAFIYRAGAPDELALRAELDEIGARQGAPVHYLVGPRQEHPEYLAPAHMLGLVPDVGQRDVYVCGPAGFTETVTSSLRALGVPRRQIHSESFEL